MAHGRLVERAGSRNAARRGDQFKVIGQRRNRLAGAWIQEVTASLDNRPFTLSLWRKLMCEGLLVAKGAKFDDPTEAEQWRYP
jgi:hypothetical protein